MSIEGKNLLTGDDLETAAEAAAKLEEAAAKEPDITKIGRASCRERV